MKSNPVGWFEIYVQDIARAKRFYETVLGTQLTRLENPGTPSEMEMWAFPMAQDQWGAAGTLVRMPGGPSGCGGTMVYFSCDDCAEQAGRVEQAGGKVEQAKMPIGQYGFMAMVLDTEGNRIGLHSIK